MHDVAPATWQRCSYLLDALREVAAFPATLLIVPHYHHGVPAGDDPAFLEAMDDCIASGDELVLHGLYHQDQVPTSGAFDLIKRHYYTAGEGEFATLSQEDARQRIEAGLELFRKQAWDVSGFVAPAWLASPGTWAALDDTALEYTTTLGGLHLLHDRGSVKSQSLVYSARSRWRRVVSYAVVEAVALHLRRAPLVRFGLHPVDAEYPSVVRHWQSLLERFRRSHAATTKRAYVEALKRRDEHMDRGLALPAPMRASAPGLWPQISQTDKSPTTTPQQAPATTSLG
jgi:predicted deacetylase